MFKVNIKNNRTINQGQWRRSKSMTSSGVFVVKFEHISHLYQQFLLLTLDMETLPGVEHF